MLFHLELKQNEKLAVSFEIQSFSLLTAVILQYLTWLCAPSYNWGKPSITTVSTRTVFTACEFSARDLAEQSRISETHHAIFYGEQCSSDGMHGCELLLFLQIMHLLTKCFCQCLDHFVSFFCIVPNWPLSFSYFLWKNWEYFLFLVSLEKAHVMSMLVLGLLGKIKNFFHAFSARPRSSSLYIN